MKISSKQISCRFDVYRVRGVSLIKTDSLTLILVLVSFILIFCLWLKRKIYLVLVFHLILQPMLVFFFQAVDYMLHGEFFALKVFPGRWALPHLALTVVWPWAGLEFQDLGPESFTRMWRLDISSLHLWYQNVWPKKSNSKTLIWKITYFCMRNETIIRVLIYGLFS